MSDMDVSQSKYTFEPESSVETVRLYLGSHKLLIRASLLSLFEYRVGEFLVCEFCPLPDPARNWIASSALNLVFDRAA